MARTPVIFHILKTCSRYSVVLSCILPCVLPALNRSRKSLSGGRKLTIFCVATEGNVSLVAAASAAAAAARSGEAVSAGRARTLWPKIRFGARWGIGGGMAGEMAIDLARAAMLGSSRGEMAIPRWRRSDLNVSLRNATRCASYPYPVRAPQWLMLHDTPAAHECQPSERTVGSSAAKPTTENF
jgi:hypothetical protein